MNTSFDLTEQQNRAREALQGKLKGKVLILGCGDNDYLDRQEGTLFYTVDICEDKIRDFKKRSRGSMCICADSRVLPFKKQIFNTIIITDLIHHLAGEDIEETKRNVKQSLSACIEVMSMKGSIYIVETLTNDWFAFIEKLTYKVVSFFVALRYKSRRFIWSKREIESLINKLGFLVFDSKLLEGRNAMFTRWNDFPIKILYKCVPRKFVFLELRRRERINFKKQ